jgi:hypothetical protein
MAIRAIFRNGRQSFEEMCDHCGEKIADLHVADITTKAENDPRTITILSGSEQVTLKTRKEKITEVSASLIRKGLLTSNEARIAYRDSKLRWGTRPEAMCSQSIDSVGATTQSYCYRTTNTNFLTKYSSSFWSSSEIETNITGSKVGVDRLGNIIRVKSEKKLHQEDTNLKYQGPNATTWWRALRPELQKRYIEGAQSTSNFVRRYGDEVRNMSVVARFRDDREFVTAVNADGGRL